MLWISYILLFSCGVGKDKLSIQEEKSLNRNADIEKSTLTR